MAHAGDELEKYYARMRELGRDALADWERDPAFIAIAAVRCPVDLEGSALGRESNRMRMRMRYEGYQMLAYARREVEALKTACDQAILAWSAPAAANTLGVALLDTPCWNLELSCRAGNVLRAAGIDTIGDLVQFTAYRLGRLPNCGKATVREIEKELDRFARLSLKGDP